MISGVDVFGGHICAKATSTIANNSTDLTVTVHPDWQAFWDSSRDAGHLTPAPASMTPSCNALQILKWTPGSTVSGTDRVPEPCGASFSPYPPNPLDRPGYAFLVIGLPVIVVVLALTGVGFALFKLYRKRKWKESVTVTVHSQWPTSSHINKT